MVATAAGDPKIAAVVSQAPFTDGLSAILANSPAGMLRMTVAGLRDGLAAPARPRAPLHARGRPARHRWR